MTRSFLQCHSLHATCFLSVSIDMLFAIRPSGISSLPSWWATSKTALQDSLILQLGIWWKECITVFSLWACGLFLRLVGVCSVWRTKLKCHALSFVKFNLCRGRFVPPDAEGLPVYIKLLIVRLLAVYSFFMTFLFFIFSVRGPHPWRIATFQQGRWSPSFQECRSHYCSVLLLSTFFFFFPSSSVWRYYQLVHLRLF